MSEQRAEPELLSSCSAAVCDRTGGLPCRRMSSQLTPADGTDERTIQQDNELEALASIFGDDFQDLRNKDPWKVTLAEHISTADMLSAADICHILVGSFPVTGSLFAG